MDILIVEDDPEVSTLLLNILERDGVNLVLATSCDESRRKLHYQSFDVVCLDNRLPDGLGIDIVEPIYHANPKTRIVVISNDSDNPEFRQQAISLGAEAVLAKPFHAGKLRALIFGSEADEVDADKEESGFSDQREKPTQ